MIICIFSFGCLEIKLLLEVVVQAFHPSILGGRGRQISVTLLTTWSTWKVLDQPVLYIDKDRVTQNDEDDKKEDKKKS